MTRWAFAKAFCADRSRFMRCAVAGFMPEDLPNNSRDAASVIDAVRAVVRTKPAGRPRAAARSAGCRGRKFVVGGGGGARGPWTAARNASSWSLSAAASSASFSAATARRRFFSFFRSFFRRFRFFSSLRSRLRFFSFLRFRLRLRSSLLELLELELELLLELDDDDAIIYARRDLASSARGTAAHTVAHRSRSLRTNAARYSLCPHRYSCCDRPLRREALRKLIEVASWISYSCTASMNAPDKPPRGNATRLTTRVFRILSIGPVAA